MSTATRTEVVLAAIRRELAERAALVDRARDLGEITITVKLQAGTTTIRGVVWQDTRVVQRA